MTKEQFITALRRELRGLSDEDIADSIDYYAELIDDRTDAGMIESDAVAALGDPAEIARDILLDMPLPKVIKTKVKKKNTWRVWEIILLILGSPIWLPLLIAVTAVFLTVYVVLWAVVVCLWAVDATLGATCIGGIATGIVTAVGGNIPALLFLLGIALTAAGLSVFGFLGCIKITVLFAKLTARFGRWVKFLFVRRKSADVEG